jgi:hypothetical protein
MQLPEPRNRESAPVRLGSRPRGGGRVTEEDPDQTDPAPEPPRAFRAHPAPAGRRHLRSTTHPFKRLADLDQNVLERLLRRAAEIGPPTA